MQRAGRRDWVTAGAVRAMLRTNAPRSVDSAPPRDDGDGLPDHMRAEAALASARLSIAKSLAKLKEEAKRKRKLDEANY